MIQVVIGINPEKQLDPKAYNWGSKNGSGRETCNKIDGTKPS